MSVANKFETFEGSEVSLFVEFLRRDEEGRNCYYCVVRDKEGNLMLPAGMDLRSGCNMQDEPDCKEMIHTLASFLQPGNGDYGSPAEAEFAKQYGEKLWMEVEDSFLGRFHSLPGVGSCRIFHHSGGPYFEDSDEDNDFPEGCYWIAQYPGCLPDSDCPVGPFDTPFQAYEDWKNT